MAEWRARGYVVDSDEEDDSQPTSLSNPSASQRACVNIGDTIDAYVPSKAFGKALAEDETDDVLVQSEAGKEAGKGSLEGIRKPTFGHGLNEHRHQDKQDDTSLLAVVTENYRSWEELPNYDDIDELQQDHYNSMPHIQPVAEPPQEAHDHPSQKPPSAASPSDDQIQCSASSSPLSSISPEPSRLLPSNAKPSAFEIDYSQAEDDSHARPAFRSSGPHGRQTTDTSSPVPEDTVSGGRVRSLRRRNPIQLHPYQIESEKYRQILKARGLKPLRITQMETEAVRACDHEPQYQKYDTEDSQLKEWEGEDATSSSPLATQEDAGDGSLRAPETLVIGDDELPDLGTLLRNPSITYVGNGFKRRKMIPPSFKMPGGPFLDQQLVISANRALEEEGCVFDVPPSPAKSGSPTSPKAIRRSIPRFRYPRMPSPPALPTPLTSSEPRQRALLDVSEDDQVAHNSPQRISTASQDGSSDLNDASSDDEPSSEIQRAQRKIRGVLPASWLKLDLKSQKTKAKNYHDCHSSPSPDKGNLQRGVARPVAPGIRKNRALLKLQHGPIDVSGYEGSSSENDDLSEGFYAQQNNMPYDEDMDILSTSRWGEAAEDDRIDAMLPTATRERARHPSKKTTQRKPVGVEGQSLSGRGYLTKEAWVSRTDQPRITENFVKAPRRESVVHPPRLSILDAHMTRETPRTPVPPFLKIASRTARRRKDKGRHSPSRKYLRLAAEKDDNDTNKTLKDWCEGTITPTPNAYSDLKLRRTALYPRSANSTLPSKTPDRLKSPKQLRLPRSKSSVRTHTRFKRPQKVQTSLDHLIKERSSHAYESSDVPEDVRVQKTCHKPKKQGQIFSTLQDPYDMRPAMLEVLRGESDQKHAQTLFERDLSRINHFDDESGLPNVLRLFDREEGIRVVGHSMHPEDRGGNQSVTKNKAPRRQSTVHRNRKRRPKHMQRATSWSGHPGPAIDADNLPNEPPSACGSRISNNLLLGLRPFGTRYSDTCDIAPLPTGTCFHEMSILGSGILAKSLGLADLSMLNCARGCLVRIYDQRTFRWGPWDDTVSSELGEFACQITQAIQDVWAHGDNELTTRCSRQAISMLKDIVTYFSDHVSFIDDIDRIACVQRSKLLTSTILNEIEQLNTDEPKNATQGTLEGRSHFRQQVSTLNLILVNSLYQLGKHDLISPQLRQDVQSVVRKSAQLTLKLALNGDLEVFEACITHLRHSTTANYIIGEQQHAVEAFVVAHHVISQYQDLKAMTLEVVQNKVPTMSPEGLSDVRIMEQCWQKLYMLLPFLEFDTKGVLETGRRFQIMFENWTLVKKLIGPVLEVSLKNPRGQAPSFNAYCRAIFGRCLRLVNDWGWRRCEAIIGTLFDFFARNNLAHLRNEESHGSPLFLSQLDRNPPLIAEPEDRVFHILLKIIGSGIKHMVQVYPEKRVRDIVWRLMPNHGRFHPKEESIRQEDLDALRNHHDLLCTLYWASPSSCRPRLSVIRNLVNLETSHREACHINIRTWFNLVQFQLSTDEPVESLVPFAEWHDDLLSQILRQHALARSEAENHVISAQQDDGLIVSKELLESTIARNQRQVEGILSDALVCLKLAVDAAISEKAAAMLVSTTVTKVFDLFDAGRPQFSKVVVQALDIVSSYASKSLTQSKASQNDNDDSQDYGDWPASDEGDELGLPSNGPEGLPLIAFQEPLRHLLSNCFGSDLVPDDALLLKLVDVWVAVAQALVRKGVKSWHDYVDRFGTDSWVSLRDTEQTRKYSVYYLAVLVERDSGIIRDHPTFFLTSWIASLVERDSMLKFQHRLTEALLNSACGEPITSNLPFWANASTGLFRISASEFSERRLSVISSVLSNMRMTLEHAVVDTAMDAMKLRQEYKDLLKHLMGTMKHNYQELGHGSNVRGAYVNFVHRVVEFLQQHTATICPIDRFFTDNGTFPLPATDPTYVVGQLKSYALRLQDARTPKQLIAFLQSVSERAAVDGQQPYLVGQLHVAMSNAFEDGTDARPTLRSFIVQAVVPAYISMAFSLESGWILALPFLQALQKVFAELLMDFDGTDINSIAVVTSIATAFLDAVRQPVVTRLSLSDPFKEARVLKTLSACYSAITALLPLWDYLARLPGSTARGEKDIDFLRSFAACLLALLRDDNDVFPLESDFAKGSTSSEIRNFATLELKDTLMKNWTCHDGQHYVIRGSTRREVVVDIGLYEEEKQELIRSLEDFSNCLKAMPALIDDDDDDRMPQRRIVHSMDALVF